MTLAAAKADYERLLDKGYSLDQDLKDSRFLERMRILGVNPKESNHVDDKRSLLVEELGCEYINKYGGYNGPTRTAPERVIYIAFRDLSEKVNERVKIARAFQIEHERAMEEALRLSGSGESLLKYH